MDPTLLNLARQMRMDIAGAGEYVSVRAPSLDLLLTAMIDECTPEHMVKAHDSAQATVAGRIASFSELAERARG